jgi:hypothetical protein
MRGRDNERWRAFSEDCERAEDVSLAGVGVDARETVGGGSRSEWIVTLGGQALEHESSAFLRTFCKPADGSTASRASSSG